MNINVKKNLTKQMKRYIVPEIVVVEIDINEVIAGSGDSVGIGKDPIDSGLMSSSRRSSSWDEYER